MGHENGGWMNADQREASRDAGITAAKDRYDRVNNGELLLSVYPGKDIVQAVNACTADERYLFDEGVIAVDTTRKHNEPRSNE